MYGQRKGRGGNYSKARSTTSRLEDLLGRFANVVNRITTLVHRHRSGSFPEVDEEPIPRFVDWPTPSTERSPP
jgi:methionyl-tRNA synthetase